MQQKRLAASVLALAACSMSQNLLAQDYEVTVTNLTRGQSFTPILAASHTSGIKLFTLGQPASAPLAALAEGGDTQPLKDLAAAAPSLVKDTAMSEGLLEPGHSVSMMISGAGASYLSVASMAIPTNDTFFAVNGVALPDSGSVTVRSPGYDAGSEPNDELCAHIPGPVCGGIGGSPEAGGEGAVHITAGIQGVGDLVAQDRDWRNPVAEIIIRRLP